MATTMRQAIACVRNVLDRKGYNYRFDADKNKFTMGFNLNRTKLKSCDIVVYVRPISGEENYCRALLPTATSPSAPTRAVWRRCANT